MRVERVGLEHHRHAAGARGHIVDDAAVDPKLAVRNRFQSGDHAQRRRLAASGRADEDHKLAVGDVEIDAAHGRLTAVDLDEIAQADGSHRSGRASPHRGRFDGRVGVARLGQDREPARTAGVAVVGVAAELAVELGVLRELVAVELDAEARPLRQRDLAVDGTSSCRP